jgi:enterochelin esterase-like enzyme
MGIDAPASILVAVAAVVLTAALLAVIWDRTRWIARTSVIVGCVLTVAATAALQLNRLTETYPSWSALFSSEIGAAVPAPTDDTAVPAPSDDAELSRPPTSAPPTSRAGGVRQSKIVTVNVAGPASGLTLPMYVYLPAAYQEDGNARFPVIEALHGYPGSPRTWIHRLRVQATLDQEILAGRMAPTIVIMPYQTTQRLRDTECTNMVGGPNAEIFLTTDVPAYVKARFRVRNDGRGWGLIGYSAGGFCAVNLLLRHPGDYTAAASLSGYGEPGITVGDGSEATTNNDIWRLTHLPQPPVSLYLTWANDDRASKREALRLLNLAKPPLSITTAVVATGGHSMAAWREMEAPAFDWLSAHLARPQR